MTIWFIEKVFINSVLVFLAYLLLSYYRKSCIT